MPTCEDIREDFSALLDEALDAETRDTVEAHLCTCSDCLRELHTLKRTSDLYRAQPRVHAPEGFEAQVMSALQPAFSRQAFFHRLNSHAVKWALAASILVVAGISFVVWQQQSQYTESAEMEAPVFFMAKAQHAAADADFQAPDLPENASTAASAPAPSSLALQTAPPEAAGAAAKAAAPEESAAGQAHGFVESWESQAREESAPSFEAPSAARQSKAEMEAMREPTLPAAAPPTAPAPEATDSAALSVQGAANSARPSAGAETAPAAIPVEAAAEKEVAGKHFYLREGQWQEAGYAAEPVVVVQRGSSEYQALLPRQEGLNQISALGARVLFRVGGTWYLLEGEAPVSP